MKNYKAVKLVLGLLPAICLTAVQPSAIAGSRPISDFLTNQGKFCIQLDGDGFVDRAASPYFTDNPTLGADQTQVHHLNIKDPILALLQDVYWRNSYGQITLPKDRNGNSVIGNLVFLAVPSAPGDGTPSSIDLTLKSNEAFFLPLWNLLGTSYNDGTPADPAVVLRVFQTLNLKLTLDGTTLLDSGNGNLMDNYSEFKFVPPIPLSADFSPANAIIRLQGISTLHGPLSPGTHLLHLDAKNIDPADAFGFIGEYHNTWNLTVKK